MGKKTEKHLSKSGVIKTLSILITLILGVNLKANSLTEGASATIKEEVQTIPTYPFHDPNPVPEIGRIYPYFRFDGYSHDSQDQEWKVVTLENEHIKLWVTPEIGGKVWGAIEKSTGKEFIYANDAAKFRAIALRGPWTSGGIEFNFGVIGHGPSVSTPVDYAIRKNNDGSVSCIIGHYDFPSRTRWNVDIRLEPGKAYFTTTSRWYNLSELPTSEFNWTNAAFKADGDFEFLYPGTHYIGHEDELAPWPMEDERNLAFYQQNTKGDYKSYHVLNTHTEFFGGYWHDEDFGYGHLVGFDEKPGKKVWIWGLSRQGMIWENLLTDSHGQYVESQSGNLFNQPVEKSSTTPFKHTTLMPGAQSQTTEKWFPLKGLGGADTATDQMVVKVEKESPEVLIVKIMALEAVHDELQVFSKNKLIQSIDLNLEPLQVKAINIDHLAESVNEIKSMSFYLKKSGELFTLNDSLQSLERPLKIDAEYDVESAYGLYVQGTELDAQREFLRAKEKYLESIKKSPSLTPAYAKLALSAYRQGHWDQGLTWAKKALSQNTYHSEANYAYGLLQTIQEQWDDAKSGFAIAAQDTRFKVASYLGLTRLSFLEKNYLKALNYANKALQHNQEQLLAWQYKALALRKLDQGENYRLALEVIGHLDPTYPLSAAEQILNSKNIKTEQLFNDSFHGELRHESILELALSYWNVGFLEDAIQLLQLADISPINRYWLAYFYNLQGQDDLSKKQLIVANQMSPELVFPYRLESLKVFEYAKSVLPHWKQEYYMALIHAHLGNTEKVETSLAAVKMTSDYAPFYLFRAQVLQDETSQKDILKAISLDEASWRAHWIAGQKLDHSHKSKHILQAYKLNSNHVAISLARAKIWINQGEYEQALAFLEKQSFLPANGGLDGRGLFYDTALKASLKALQKSELDNALLYAKKAQSWPENLGAGKPGDYDDRLDNFLLGVIYLKKNQKDLAEQAFKNAQSYDGHHLSTELLAQFISAQMLGDKTFIEKLIARYGDEENPWVRWSVSMIETKEPWKKKQSDLTFKQEFLMSLYEIAEDVN